MLAAAFLSCVRSSGSCITSSRKLITRIFSPHVLRSKSWGPTREQHQSHYRSVAFPLFFCKEREKVKYITCECLETQWRSTFRTRLVAALRITNSLSPFLWSVGKPAARLTKVAVKIHSHNDVTLWNGLFSSSPDITEIDAYIYYRLIVWGHLEMLFFTKRALFFKMKITLN